MIGQSFSHVAAARIARTQKKDAFLIHQIAISQFWQIQIGHEWHDFESAFRAIRVIRGKKITVSVRSFCAADWP
jgi:hypothetical protein